MPKDFFPSRPASNPTIYAFEDSHPQNAGLLKVGYTTRTAKQRLDEIYPLKTPGKPFYRIVLEEPAMRGDGSYPSPITTWHRMLRINGIKNPEASGFNVPWPRSRSAIQAIRKRAVEHRKPLSGFQLRPEQIEAVKMTAEYFQGLEKRTS